MSMIGSLRHSVQWFTACKGVNVFNMARGKQMSTEDKVKIVVLAEEKNSLREILRKVGFSYQAVSIFFTKIPRNRFDTVAEENRTHPFDIISRRPKNHKNHSIRSF